MSTIHPSHQGQLSPPRGGRYAFIDVEVRMDDNRVHDIGALRDDGAVLHKASREELMAFQQDVTYLCGHNIIHHDAKYLFGDRPHGWILVDTLYASPLLFPEHPYHRLVKDDKLESYQLNNPVNDCEKARVLLFDEIYAWQSLAEDRQAIFSDLLAGKREFEGFLHMMGAKPTGKNTAQLIRAAYHDKICLHAEVESMVERQPCELAYALALIDTHDSRSVTPGWVPRNFPQVENTMRLLRHKRCPEGCPYCERQYDVHRHLMDYFGFSQFRSYGGEPLQQQAAQAAALGQSLLAVFPTSGGKSLAFQRTPQTALLQSGDMLEYKDFTLYDPHSHTAVARLSQRMCATLADWQAKGYHVRYASVRFVVMWKPKDAPRGSAETPVLLPELVLSL